MPSMSRLPTIFALCAVTISAVACTASPEGPDVARVETPDAARSAVGRTSEVATPAEADDSRRPVLRVADSEDRVAALWNAYSSCLLRNGAKKPKEGGLAPALGGTSDSPGVLVDLPAPRRAQAACRQLEPRQAPELDATTNPRFHELSLDYVACLRRSGLYVRLLNGRDLSSTFVEGHTVPDDQVEISNRCLERVFGEK